MTKTRTEKFKSNYLKFFNRNKAILVAGFATAFLMVLLYIAFEVAPFGDRMTFRMDLYHQYGPLYAELYERLTNLQSFSYSWNSGLGSSFLGNFYNYLSSPLSFIIVFFGHKNIPDAVSALIFIKCVLSAVTFSYFLKKTFKKDDYIISAFGVLYAFSGYFIAYYWNVMWIDAMYLLPLVALGINRLIKDGKGTLYCIALAVTLFSNYYMGFMMCIFSVIYFIYYYAVNYTLSSGYVKLEKAEYKKQSLWFKLKNSIFLTRGTQFALLSVLAVGLVAFALLPLYFALQSSSATSGTFPTEFKTYFSLFDFLANHLAGLEPTIRSSGEDVLPNIYSGVMLVVLLPLFFFLRKISVREKVVTLGVLSVFVLSFNINYLNYIWHGFHFPNDLPYRFSFMYSFFILLIGYKVLRNITEFKPRELLFASIAAMSFIVFAQKLESKNVTTFSVAVSLVFIVLYFFVFSMMSSKRFQATALASLLLICVLCEVAVADIRNFEIRQSKSSFTSDLGEFEGLQENLNSVGGDEFYRTELTWLRTRMDPSWYNYQGISTFSSMAYEHVANLQKYLGLSSNFINSYTYGAQTPVYNMMFALKYLVKTDTTSNIETDFYSELLKTNKFTAYKINDYLPLGFAVNANVMNWQFDHLDPFVVQNEFFKLATGLDEDPLVRIPINRNLSAGGVTVNHTSEDEDSFSITSAAGTEGRIIFTNEFDKPEHVYLYLSGQSIESGTVDNGTAVNSINISRPHVLDAGIVSPENPLVIDMKVPTATTNGTFDVYLYKINEEVFKKGFDILHENTLKITSFKETEITGTFNLKESQLLYTSIPYDKGWSVYIDGQEASENRVVAVGDALIGIMAPAGEHDIVLKFTARGLTTGIAVSIVMLLFAALLFMSRKRLQKLLKPVPVLPESVPVSDDHIEIDPSDTPVSDEVPPDHIDDTDVGYEIPPESTNDSEVNDEILLDNSSDAEIVEVHDDHKTEE